MHNTQQLRLMQLASSALPVGSFTWSQGLEWAVEIGWVKSVDDFSAWQIQQMEQNFFTVDLPLLARLYRACEQDDLDAARRWSAYLLACRETRELRDEERSRGAAFTRLVTDWEADCSRVAHSLHRQPTLRHGLAGRALENSPDRTGVKSRLQLD